MDDLKHWFPVRYRHTDYVAAEGPFDSNDDAKRERRVALSQLETEAEIGIPFLAASKAEAEEIARKRLSRNPDSKVR